MTQIAKLFTMGDCQAIRLPADFRFEGDEVYIRRDHQTGDVILSEKPDSWDGFFELLKDLKVPEDFLSPEERCQGSRDLESLGDM